MRSLVSACTVGSLANRVRGGGACGEAGALDSCVSSTVGCILCWGLGRVHRRWQALGEGARRACRLTLSIRQHGACRHYGVWSVCPTGAFTSSLKVVPRFPPNDVIKMSCCCHLRSWRDCSSTEMSAAVICSAVGCPAAGQSTETKADACRNAMAMAALASTCLFCRHFCNQESGLQHPTARHAGSRDAMHCHFGATFDAWAE